MTRGEEPARRAGDGGLPEPVAGAGEVPAAGPLRVDAHHHLWELSRRPHGWLDAPELAAVRRDFTPTELAEAAGAAGIGRTVLVQVLADATETREFLATAEDQALIGAVVGWADLTAPGLAGELHALRESRGGRYLAGIRHLVQGEPDPAWLARPEVVAGLRTVAAHGLAYDLLVRPHQLPAAIAAVRAVPELTFVLDHAAKPPVASGALEPWASLTAELAAESNVSCKLSGLVTEAGPGAWTVTGLRPYARAVLDTFGPARVMFGSDWPVCLTAAGSYGEVLALAEELTAGLSAPEHAAVFGGTAARVYRLDERPGR
ncbi:amidohydrolase family protein [Streptomyces zingiberis]|uniref:Amidohydrolase family protein n=1 Tax=Streptomyces zingiberis TaxID=2053010 RepID=A0ABX1C9K5_9ACTN|nr:amidohydrolase family protein [Streptomyces zingiberis]NJQ03619.1 amidohydrolase family protein [Streptomyces zingiberis]